METHQLRRDIWQLSALEPGRRIFGPASYSDEGVGYNAYLLDTGAGFVSLGAVPERFLQAWVNAVEQICGGRLSAAVFFGTDDDRGAISALLEKNPAVTVIAGKRTLFALRETPARSIEVRSGRTLTLGSHTLRFHVLQERYATASIYVVDLGQHALFTADAFGSVCAAAGMLSALDDTGPYWRGVAKYFADLFGQRRQQSLSAAVKLVREHEIQYIFPSCGPAADRDLERLLQQYLSKPAQPEKHTAALVYAPGNFVPELARRIADGLQDVGGITLKTYDLSAVNREEVLAALAQAGTILFGTPEIQGDGAKSVWDLLTSLGSADCAGKIAGIFVSFFSEGQAAAHIRARLEGLGFDTGLSELAVQGYPGQQELNRAYEYGYAAGCYIRRIPNPRKPRLVRCPICGEIFDASLGICPVCGVGIDRCIPVEQAENTFQNNSNRRYLIIGGGAAAVSAAEAIRQRDGTGSITLLSAEDHLPINRPMLTKDLERLEKDPNSIFMHPADWYAERDIALRLGVQATAIRPKERTVSADDGRTYAFDKLIYAAGAECFVPPLPGHDKPGVLTVRHLRDTAALQAARKQGAQNAVVIGGGVLGLEAASELMRFGLHVTVLEATPQIVGRQIDPDSASLLKAAMAGMGVACLEGVTIAEITGKDRAEGVALADGRVFPAEIVIVSCGNRANIGIAKEAGIAAERAILVNERMETNVPCIYACGDCAQLAGVNFQLWQEAVNQGKVAGANAAGEPAAFANVPLGLSLEGFGTSLFAMGDAGKRQDLPYKTVEVRDAVAGRHEKYWFFGGRLEGAVVIGAPEKAGEIAKAVSEKAQHRELF